MPTTSTFERLAARGASSEGEEGPIYEFDLMISPVWSDLEQDRPYIICWVGRAWPTRQALGPLGELWSGEVTGESAEEVEKRLSSWMQRVADEAEMAKRDKKQRDSETIRKTCKVVAR